MKLLIITLLLYAPLTFAKTIISSPGDSKSQCVWNGNGATEVRMRQGDIKSHFNSICAESGTRSSCIKQSIRKHWGNDHISICKWAGKIDSNDKYNSCKQVGEYQTTVLSPIPVKQSKHITFENQCTTSETIICRGAMLCGKKDYYDDVICLGNKHGACPSIQKCAASAKVKTHFPKKFDVKFKNLQNLNGIKGSGVRKE